MPVQTQMQVRRGTASSWTSTNPTLAAGELGFETDTGKFKIGTGSSTWTALLYAGGGQSSLTTYQYTATAAQTTFSGTDANGNTLAYTVGAVQVYLNGALLQNTADYAATNGTSVVLTAGALVGDSLTILSLATFAVANTYTQAQADALFIADTIVDAKGDIIAATAADTVSRLAVGANDQVLIADSTAATGLKWGTPSSGGMTLISTTTLTGASVTISSISQAYKNLYAIITGVTNASSTGLFRCAPNGTTNITSSLINYPATTWNNDINSFLRFTGDGANGALFTNANNSYALYIHNYTSTTAYKPFSVNGGYNNPGNQQATLTTGHIQTNTAITSLVFSNAGGNLSTGTVLLYGVN